MFFLMIALPAFFICWPVQSGVCVFTERCKHKALFRAILPVIIVISDMIQVGKITHHVPEPGESWCPTGSGISVMFIHYLTIGAVLGTLWAWYRYEKKSDDVPSEEDAEEKKK